MAFEDFRRERFIVATLRGLSRQRVSFVLQPGNVWVVERAIEATEETDAALKTCYMRGWVEPLEEAIPQGKLTPEGELPKGAIFTGEGPLYRLTDSGWAVINRSHQMTLLGIFLALLALIEAFW